MSENFSVTFFSDKTDRMYGTTAQEAEIAVLSSGEKVLLHYFSTQTFKKRYIIFVCG
ncbi:MAG: hypothetical protein U9N77_13975 [Thermodesulfobacteriota bacterium]|nr:hypothetical protein [Thermodesulfobacteriota bacterium]